MNNHPLLNSMLLLALAAVLVGARAHEAPSVSLSLLRGSEPSIPASELARRPRRRKGRDNKCADHEDPMNCIDCRKVHDGECDPDTPFTVPYSCSEGLNLCCTVSNIDKPKFGAKYGKCTKNEDDGEKERDAGRDKSDCVADGDPVFMDLYKGPYGYVRLSLFVLCHVVLDLKPKTALLPTVQTSGRHPRGRSLLQRHLRLVLLRQRRVAGGGRRQDRVQRLL